MITFKQIISERTENINQRVLSAVAHFLHTDIEKLVDVGMDLETEVLDRSKEVNREIINVASGNIIIRVFKNKKDLFVRIENPNGDRMMYQAPPRERKPARSPKPMQ